MTIAESRQRLNKAVHKLNTIQNALDFEVEETEYSVGFTNHGKWNKSTTYGVYSHASLFDEFKTKTAAYNNAVNFAEAIIHAAALNEPKAYHNICEL